MRASGLCRVIRVSFFKQKTAYEMRISDWSSDVCSSDLGVHFTTPMMQLQDPKQTKVLIVTLAETTPVLEAANLHDDRSAERRAGKGCDSTCRSRWSPDHSKKKQHNAVLTQVHVRTFQCVIKEHHT